VWVEGAPERSESLGEHEVPTRPNPLGSREGHGFFGERNPLKRRYQVLRGLVAKRESGKRKGRTLFRSRKRSNALKGETQECRKLKEAFRDSLELTPSSG
jgi:hypothetical protein